MRLPGGREVEIIAHRGAGGPENTLPAFRRAWELGADACELDFHKSADGELVVIHDFSTREITDGRVDWKVRDRTLAEIQSLLADPDLRPPALGEVIAAMPPGRRLYAEAKPGPELADALARVVRACGRPPRDLAFISFNTDTVRAIRKSLPEHAVFQVVEFVESGGDWEAQYLVGPGDGEQRATRDFDALLREARAAELAGVDTGTLQPPGFTTKLIAAGLRWIVWTVNDADLARSLVRRGAHGLTTDVPETIRAALASRRVTV